MPDTLRITFRLRSPLQNTALASLVQSPAAFHETRRKRWRRQGNLHFGSDPADTCRNDPNPDKSGNQNSNPGPLLAEVRHIDGGMLSLSATLVDNGMPLRRK